MRVDLHVHSTASDGEYAPAEVVKRAWKASLDAIALTDHDTLAGLPEAEATGAQVGLRVVRGCEFSVAGPGGEMHLLAYFLPAGDPALLLFLEEQRRVRLARATEMLRRLQRRGLAISENDVSSLDRGSSAVGRPHVARLLVSRGLARSVQDAFERYLREGKPAFVSKTLPSVEEVADLVHSVGGLVSAAHLKERATRNVLMLLRDAGVDAVEVMHPGHGDAIVERLMALTSELRLLRTGGSDWHGEHERKRDNVPLGGVPVPETWLHELTTGREAMIRQSQTHGPP